MSVAKPRAPAEVDEYAVHIQDEKSPLLASGASASGSHHSYRDADGASPHEVNNGEIAENGDLRAQNDGEHFDRARDGSS